MKFALFSLALAFSLTGHAITLGTYNIRNFDYDERSRIHTNKPELANVFKSLNADLMALQEVNNTLEFGKFLTSRLPGYDFETTRCGGAHGQKLGFLFKTATMELLSFNEDLAISEPGRSGTCDSGSRPLAIGLFKVRSTGQKFYAIAVHLKSGGAPDSISKRKLQYQIIKKTVMELRSKTGVKDFFIAGDFNTTEYRNRGVDYVELTKVVKDLGMTDLVSGLACTAYWWGGTDDQIESPSVLDHVLVTPGLMKVKSAAAQSYAHCQKVSCQEVPIKKLGVVYESVSDHCPISAKVQ